MNSWFPAANQVAQRTAVAATIGGTASVLGGGKFANGAVTAAFTHLFNAEATRPKPKYSILNESETVGKKITGAYVSDANNLMTMGSPDGRHLSGYWKDAVLAKISSINEELAARGEAVEVVMVENADGYAQYLNRVKGYDSIKIFAPSFHGSGSMAFPVVNMRGTDPWPVDDYAGKTGFTPFTKNFLPQGCAYNPIYCMPLSNVFQKDVNPYIISNALLGHR